MIKSVFIIIYASKFYPFSNSDSEREEAAFPVFGAPATYWSTAQKAATPIGGLKECASGEETAVISYRPRTHPHALSQDRLDIFSQVSPSISSIYSERPNLLPHSMQRRLQDRHPTRSFNSPLQSLHFMVGFSGRLVGIICTSILADLCLFLKSSPGLPLSRMH